MHVARRHTLLGGEQIGVAGELDGVTRGRVPGELGVDGLVGEALGRVGRLNAPQEVRMAVPGRLQEGGLVDDLHAALQGFTGRLCAIFQGNVRRDLRDGVAGLQVVEEGALVGVPVVLDERHLRVVGRALERFVQGLEIEPGRVRAAQEAEQVRGGAEKVAVAAVHEEGSLDIRSAPAPTGAAQALR